LAASELAVGVRITAEVIRAIEAHARETAPDECCGLLIGTPDVITLSVPARNIADERRRRYEIDPRDHFDAIRRARTLDLDVVGAYHSHPHSAPVPSQTDRSEAFESFLFLIVGLESETRGWRLSSGNFVEIPLVRSL
jgi:proteasome lid subunit RPN8/RPN11